jgi:hypothetical protein
VKKAKQKPAAKKAKKPAAKKSAAKPAKKQPAKKQPAFPAVAFFFEVLAVAIKAKPYGETLATKVDRALITFTNYLHDELDKLKKEAATALGDERVDEILPIAASQGVDGLDAEAATSMLRAILDSKTYDSIEE